MPEGQLTSGFSWLQYTSWLLMIRLELGFLQLNTFLLANDSWVTISDVNARTAFHIISGLIGEVYEWSEIKSRHKVHSHYSQWKAERVGRIEE